MNLTHDLLLVRPNVQAKRATTVGRQARSVVRRILHSPGLASYRRRPLSLHVRPHQRILVRYVHQGCARDVNSRKHRVQQGFASAPMGGLEASAHRTTCSLSTG